jgi:hypothetical protein
MRTESRLLWSLLLGAALLSIAACAFPLFVIQPFKYQDPVLLSIALGVRRWGPWAATLAAGLALYCVVALWPRSRWLARLGAAAFGLLALTGSAVSFVNVFEKLMFAPVERVELVPAREARIDADDLVMAVRLNEAARAYPIRMLAYHHVVNDWVGGVPLAGTY